MPMLENKGVRARREYRCSFCDKSQDMVKRLIAGPRGVYICDECIALCQEIISEEARVTPPVDPLEGQYDDAPRIRRKSSPMQEKKPD